MRSALERRIREKYLKIAHIIAKYAFFYLNIKRSIDKNSLNPLQ